MFGREDYFSGWFKAAEEKEERPVLRGNMHRAIVLKAPDETFAEAVFILKDSFLQGEGVSHKELMRQAGEAASLYCGRRRRVVSGLAPAAVFLLGAATAILTLWALGLF